MKVFKVEISWQKKSYSAVETKEKLVAAYDFRRAYDFANKLLGDEVEQLQESIYKTESGIAPVSELHKTELRYRADNIRITSIVETDMEISVFE